MICKGTLLVNGEVACTTLYITKEKDKNISYQAANTSAQKSIMKLGHVIKITFTHEVIDEDATCIMPQLYLDCNYIEVL